MSYLNLDLDFFDHPKTKRLVGLLGRGSDVLPVRLWCYCGKYHADTGHLTGYSPTEIETVIGWWGQPGRALEALLRPFQERPGFLERIENGYKVHDWEEINGHIAALKERGKVASKARWDKYRTAKAMLKHSNGNALSNAPSSPSLPSIKESIPISLSSKTSRRRKPKTLIPSDWQIPQEILEWCKQERLPDPEYQRKLFIIHWQEKDEARPDWNASFKKWMLSPYRKDKQDGQNGRNGGQGGYQSSAERNASAAAKAYADIEEAFGPGSFNPAPDSGILPLSWPAESGEGGPSDAG